MVKLETSHVLQKYTLLGLPLALLIGVHWYVPRTTIGTNTAELILALLTEQIGQGLLMVQIYTNRILLQWTSGCLWVCHTRVLWIKGKQCYYSEKHLNVPICKMGLVWVCWYIFFNFLQRPPAANSKAGLFKQYYDLRCLLTMHIFWYNKPNWYDFVCTNL